MRISDWSSDVCSSDLPRVGEGAVVGSVHALSPSSLQRPAARAVPAGQKALDSILRTGQEPQRSFSLRSAQGTSMPRQLISSGSPFEAQVGYSRAVVQGDWCFVAGTTGTDPEQKAIDRKSVV